MLLRVDAITESIAAITGSEQSNKSITQELEEKGVTNSQTLWKFLEKVYNLEYNPVNEEKYEGVGNRGLDMVYFSPDEEEEFKAILKYFGDYINAHPELQPLSYDKSPERKAARDYAVDSNATEMELTFQRNGYNHDYDLNKTFEQYFTDKEVDMADAGQQGLTQLDWDGKNPKQAMVIPEKLKKNFQRLWTNHPRSDKFTRDIYPSRYPYYKSPVIKKLKNQREAANQEDKLGDMFVGSRDQTRPINSGGY